MGWGAALSGGCGANPRRCVRPIHPSQAPFRTWLLLDSHLICGLLLAVAATAAGSLGADVCRGRRRVGLCLLSRLGRRLLLLGGGLATALPAARRLGGL